MRIDQLRIELRPRSNAQALDLGYALLRSHAGATWMAFLALWLPLVGLCAGLTLLWPALFGYWILLAWWLRPLLERAPLYVLSRQVFGASVGWREAVRAWPRQLGGGWFAQLTWKRPFSAARALYLPVWQLEQARGEVARSRRRILAAKGTGVAAWFFGVICFWLEAILQLGLIGLVGLCISPGQHVNPFALFAMATSQDDGVLRLVLLLAFGVAGAVMAPIYTACGFTLYLNRRAALEAWDLELQLRQITRPALEGKARRAAASALLAAGFGALLALAPAPPAFAAAPARAVKSAPTCAPPFDPDAIPARSKEPGPEQARIRAQLDALYAADDLRGYDCVLGWHLKRSGERRKKQPDDDGPGLDLPAFAALLKVLLIAAAVGAVGWLLFRYADRFARFAGPRRPALATEVGGLDIRAESLPADVGAAARALWQEGRRRAALALLYRATLSRLVTEDKLAVRQGDTEGDCLRLARQAEQARRTSRARLDVAVTATGLWLEGAYADRWPDQARVFDAIAAWEAQFNRAPGAPS